MPLIEKKRGLSPGGRFPPSFIQVIIITGLNKLHNCMFLPCDPQGFIGPWSINSRLTVHQIYQNMTFNMRFQFFPGGGAPQIPLVMLTEILFSRLVTLQIYVHYFETFRQLGSESRGKPYYMSPPLGKVLLE